MRASGYLKRTMGPLSPKMSMGGQDGAELNRTLVIAKPAEPTIKNEPNEPAVDVSFPAASYEVRALFWLCCLKLCQVQALKSSLCRCDVFLMFGVLPSAGGLLCAQGPFCGSED